MVNTNINSNGFKWQAVKYLLALLAAAMTVPPILASTFLSHLPGAQSVLSGYNWMWSKILLDAPAWLSNMIMGLLF